MIKNINTMKIKALLLSFALIASLGSAFAILKFGDGGMGSGGMQIQMMSRMVAVSPIITEITPKKNIDIAFMENMGVVYATIKNNRGITVSQSKTNTSFTPNLEIKIANLPKGSYTLTITNKVGATLKTEKFTVD